MDRDGGKRRSRTFRYVSGVVVSGVLGIVVGAAYSKVVQGAVSVPLCAGLGVYFGGCTAVSYFIEGRLRRSWAARACYILMTVTSMVIGSIAGNLAFVPQTSGAELLVKAIASALCGVIFGAVGLTLALTKSADN